MERAHLAEKPGLLAGLLAAAPGFTPPLSFHPDGTIEKQRSEARWWSGCIFAPDKTIIAASEEIHGSEDARETVVRQPLERLDAADI